MATIRKRGTNWQVQVRRTGYPALSKSFAARSDALVWAREKERSIDRAELPKDVKSLRKITVSDLLTRYALEITPNKRGATSEGSRIRQIQSHPIASLSLSNLTTGAIARYRDDRLKAVQSASVRRELTILRHVFETAIREWDIALPNNPVKRIKLPPDAKPRRRRLENGESALLLSSIGPRTASYMIPFICLLIETGMRRGELLSVRWQDVSLSEKTLWILKTKNGHPRQIPLTPAAIAILKTMPSSGDTVFTVSANAVRLAWERLRSRAGLTNLRMHDLRHEAVSRFFEMGLSTPEVALISGHREPRMLARYTHLQPQRIAEKMNNAHQRTAES